jgi:hypothetical protein
MGASACYKTIKVWRLFASLPRYIFSTHLQEQQDKATRLVNFQADEQHSESTGSSARGTVLLSPLSPTTDTTPNSFRFLRGVLMS